MTIREQITYLITEALTADETILENEVLDANNHIIFAASELASRSSDLFLEPAEDYISQVKTFLNGLPTELPIASIFPKAINLAIFLDLANLLDLDDLEDPVPPELAQLNLSEVTNLEAYNRDDSPVQLYVFENPNQVVESFAFIDMTVGARLVLPSVPKKMTTCAALLVGRHQSSMVGKKWVISFIAEEDRHRSYVKYHLLLEGKRLTNAILAPLSNSLVGIAETLTGASDYGQFDEPFEILGETNGRTTVLDTILSCYHVLENYMIRAQIAKVANANTSALFGIRHFKQLELAVTQREQGHLVKLFDASWGIDIGGLNLGQFVDGRFNALFRRADFLEPQFQNFMQRLTVKKQGELLDIQNSSNLRVALPKIIYQVRCSIVHNKETEFHLSNKELADPIVLMTLTELCLPCMQRLAFGLPAAPAPNPLRYNHPALQLY